MLDALRAEITAQTTLRSTAVYLVLLVGSLVGPVVLLGALDPTRMSSDEPLLWTDLFQGFFIFLALAVALAASRTTGDLKNHMSAQAFLTQQGRWQSLAAKLAVLVSLVAATFVVGTGLIAVAVLLFGGSVDTADLAPIGAAFALAVTVAAASVGFGAFVRNTIVAVTLPIVWLFVGEILVVAAGEKIEVLRGVKDVLLTTSYDHLGAGEGTGAALAVLAGWILVLCAAGFASNQLRDVR